MQASDHRVDYLMEAKMLRHCYGNREVLKLDHWALKPGENQCLLGPSGSGKTTLLSILTGLLQPTAGDVHVRGQRLNGVPSRKLDALRASSFGLVFQDHHLVSSLTLEENLAFAQHITGRIADHAWMDHLLGRLQLQHRKQDKPHTLSRGEAQRAAIARAAACRPPIIVADEPTSALDDDNAERAITLLADLCRECASTLIVASHDWRLRPHFQKHLYLMPPEEKYAS